MNQQIVVPIALFAMIFGIVFGIVYLKSRENMALIERGINPKDGQPRLYRQAGFLSLKFGLFLAGIGLGLIAAYIIDVIVLKHGVPGAHEDNSPAIYFALIAIGGGLGLIISYFIEKKHAFDNIKSGSTTTINEKG